MGLSHGYYKDFVSEEKSFVPGGSFDSRRPVRKEMYISPNRRTPRSPDSICEDMDCGKA